MTDALDIARLARVDVDSYPLLAGTPLTETDHQAIRNVLADITEQGFAIVKHVSRAELERAFENACNQTPSAHEAAVLLVAKRCIFGESLEVKI
jgi:hypothetical protein